MTTRIGLIGLGTMGLPMGKRLVEAGHEVTVVPHVNRAPADELAGMGARVAEKPAEVAQACELVITIVPDVPQVREVLFGDGGLASADKFHPDLLYIDMSTITPLAAREFGEQLASRGVAVLDAPVSGGPMRAADGSLTIMVGGHAENFERARPVLTVMGKNIVHVGGPGTGQAVKLAN